jgi:hypothetical protein
MRLSDSGVKAPPTLQLTPTCALCPDICAKPCRKLGNVLPGVLWA